MSLTGLSSGSHTRTTLPARGAATFSGPTFSGWFKRTSKTPKAQSDEFVHEQQQKLLGLELGQEEEAQKIKNTLTEIVFTYQGQAFTAFDVLNTLKTASKKQFQKAYWFCTVLGLTIGGTFALAGMPLGLLAFGLGLQAPGLGIGNDMARTHTGTSLVKHLRLPMTLSSKEQAELAEKLEATLKKLQELGLVYLGRWSGGDRLVDFRPQGKIVLENFEEYLKSQPMSALQHKPANTDDAVSTATKEQSSSPKLGYVSVSLDNLDGARATFKDQIAGLLKDQENCQRELTDTQAAHQEKQTALAALEESLTQSNEGSRERQRLENELEAEREVVDLHRLYLKTLEEKTPAMVEDIKDTISRIKINLTQIEKIRLTQKTLEAAKSLEEKQQFDARVATLMQEINTLQKTIKAMLDAENLDAKLTAMALVKAKLAEVELAKATLQAPQSVDNITGTLSRPLEDMAETEEASETGQQQTGLDQ